MPSRISVDDQNMMIRALNSIEAQVQKPQTEAQKNSFVGYILCLCIFVKAHHDSVCSFPALDYLTYQGRDCILPGLREAVSRFNGS